MNKNERGLDVPYFVAAKVGDDAGELGVASHWNGDIRQRLREFRLIT